MWKKSTKTNRDKLDFKRYGLQTSEVCAEEGLRYRSARPVEPEAVFATVTVKHNIRKYISRLEGAAV